MSTIILIALAVIALGVSLKKDKDKTVITIKQARNMMKGMLSDIVGILLLIGLVLTLIPSETIESLIGSESGFLAVILSAVLGTITLIPAFVAFPLIGSLKSSGAGIVTLTAFLTTLTMVGFLTMPLEIKTFGKKFTIVRNSVSFVFAILIALSMGVIL
ncbi:MAG: permease [Clostridiales bacterium]|nr:permease [Clostridiales bacterium]